MTSLDEKVNADAAGDVVLRDGTRVHVRPIRPEDDRVMIDAFRHLSPQTVYQRFFAAMPEMSAQMAHHLSHVNYTNRMALVAETAEDTPPRLMGVGRFEPVSDPVQPDVVEIGLIVFDEWQGRGLGRILLRETLRIAVQHGFHRYSAEILSDNRKILRLLSTETKILESKSSGGVTSLLLESR